ncbi:glycosyltransferase family 4 protein [Acinetobacter indicus]|uniref:glycosyltransferase family 4 protein n=1 Tax=Acinetobacter indicus TaxID=756892 RepID=UPI002577DA0D|nr:glycosyltransferase family 4 protein [Acinetobacter indicus]
MSKDVILDKYARLYEIPNQLALLGHQVECYCLSYQSHDDGIWDDSNELKQLIWHSRSYKGLSKFKIWSYPFFLLQQLKKQSPDIIIAASDIPHVVFGCWLAQKLNKPFVADLYDNFEGFGQAKIPFMKTLLRKSVQSAQLVTTTSQPLAELVKNQYLAKGKVVSMPSTIDREIFFPRDKIEARNFLGLPLDKKLIGTAGGLYHDKGISVIYEAWEIVKSQIPDALLVLAGPYQKEFPIPTDDRIVYLGSLQHRDVATLFQALDLGVISILDTPFGRYCFPQKAFEMLACELPVVVSNIGEMQYLFKAEANTLFKSEDPIDLANTILKKMNALSCSQHKIEDWSEIMLRMNQDLIDIYKRNYF